MRRHAQGDRENEATGSNQQQRATRPRQKARYEEDHRDDSRDEEHVARDLGIVPVRSPYVSHVEHATAVNDHATGDTPDRCGCRTVRTICGTTIATPRVAPT